MISFLQFNQKELKMTNHMANVFINYLPSDFTKENLETLCSRFGKIKSAKIMINLSTGNSRGFGFVRFFNNQSAQQCVNHLNGYQIRKKKLIARLTDSIENVGSPTNSIYIKSLPLTYEKPALWSLFEQFGEIRGIEIVLNQKTGLPKGSAYITYSTQEEALRAIHEMNNVVLEKDCWPLFIRYTEKQVIETEFVRSGILIEMPKSKENNSQVGNSNQGKNDNGHQTHGQNVQQIQSDEVDFSKMDLYRQLLEDIEKEESSE